MVAVTLQKLVDAQGTPWSVEEELVLDALRRSRNDLMEASESALASYIRDLEPNQFRGVVSNVKGIYHELLFEAAENADGDETMATLAEATNQPGWDLEFTVDGEAIGVVQLKAVASIERIQEHLAQYPDIAVLTTDEVAALVPGVGSSGFSNADLERDVREVLGDLPGDALHGEIVEAAGTSLLVSAAYAAHQALQAGRVDPRKLKAAMGDLGVGLTTALALDVLIGGP